MDRRAFLGTLAGSLLAAPLADGAQPSDSVARVGILSIEVESLDNVSRVAFVTALKDLGWIVGQNLLFEARYAAGQPNRLAALAAELVRLKVDVIITFQNQEALAVQQATASIPFVMYLGVYPEQVGLVASLAHPGGNVTGTTVGAITGGKYLELLKEAVPKLKRVARLSDPTFPGFTAIGREQVGAEARRLSLTLTPIAAQRPADVESALARVAKERPGAMWVAPVGSFGGRAYHIIGFATTERLPTIFPARFFAEVGALMSLQLRPRASCEAGGLVCRPHSKGSEAGGSPRGAANQVRAGHQPQDGQGDRPDDPAVAPAAG
jgi:ABC-type uncharacterized transport system substrate-binding protein